jgi:hypothetical protein
MVSLVSTLVPTNTLAPYVHQDGVGVSDGSTGYPTINNGEISAAITLGMESAPQSASEAWLSTGRWSPILL